MKNVLTIIRRHTSNFLVLSALLVALATKGQQGILDLTFDPGVSTTGFADYVHAIAVQDDGRIIIAGGFDTYQGQPRSGIARLLADGTLDATFDPGTGVDGNNAIIYTVLLDPDGRIVIGGSFWTYNGVDRRYLARLNADGSLDTTFDPGTETNNPVYAVEHHAGNKYLVGGAFINNATGLEGLVRLEEDGTIDPSFNPGGTGAQSTVRCIAVYDDDRIVIGGQFNDYNGIPSNGIARLLPSGAYDLTFDVGTGCNGTVYTVLLQGTEHIIVGGGFNAFDGVPRGAAVRLLEDGSLDAGFIPDSGFNGYVRASCTLADSTLLIAGEFISFNDLPLMHLVVLDPDGSLNATFTTDPGTNADVWAAASQSDGKVLLGGVFTTYDGLPRKRIARINGTSATAIAESGAGSFLLYPDPVHDVLQVRFPMYGSVVQMEVRDHLGKRVLEQKVSGTTSIAVQALAAGVYTVHVPGYMPHRFIKE